MNVRVTIDGEVVSTAMSFGRFVEAMLDSGHTPEEVAGMMVELMHHRTVKDGGGASPTFEYVLLPPVPAFR